MPPRERAPDLTGVAVFTLDAAGRVASWSAAATRQFGHAAAEVIGRDICDVLLTGAGQRRLVRQALAEAAAGRVWSATMAAAFAPDGSLAAFQFEPLPWEGAGALVIARLAAPQAGSDLLRDAASRIGTTLDLARTAQEVIDVAVPAFADAAAVFVSERLLADEPGSAPTGSLAVVRRLAARLEGHPPAVADSLLPAGELIIFSGDSPSLRAMTTGRPIRFSGRGAGIAERSATYPGGREIMDGYTSFLATPLEARGVVLGSMTLARRAGGPVFGPGDIALAAELGSRAAVSIDNARLYHREQRTAVALQRGLLPAEPQQPPGLEVAHRYLPVGGNVVGGDWHDITAVRGGGAALIVGDAMGHGPEAAAVMVQLRTAAHTLAELGLPPEEVLHKLDGMVAGMPEAPFATCVAAMIDPAAGSCVIVKAGHPPPVLALPGGSTRVLKVPPGLPLGLDGGPFEPARISLPPGACLALYTDGLVESRSRSLDTGLAMLREALSAAMARPGESLDDCCEAVTQALRQRGEDDITLVLARIRPLATAPATAPAAADPMS